MKKNVLVIAGMLSVCLVYGQRDDTVVTKSMEEITSDNFQDQLKKDNQVEEIKNRKQRLIKISPIYLVLAADRTKAIVPAISYERQIKPDLTWILTAYGPASHVHDLFDDLEFLPGLAGGVRYYYNINDRLMKGKAVDKFSANYFGAMIGFQNEIGLLNLMWGMQRKLGSSFYIDWNAGFQNDFSVLDPGSGSILFNNYYIVIGLQTGLAF